MWPKHRLFGIDPKALKQELARRDLAVRARVGQLTQEAERMRTEIDRLQAEVAMLQALERDLKAQLTAEESTFSLALESHAFTLQQLHTEINYLRSVRTRVVDQVREVLLPYLGERAKEGRQCLRSGA